MSDITKKIALVLEPLNKDFKQILLVKLLVDYFEGGSWIEANQLVKDIRDGGPQVLWVASERREGLEEKLAELEVGLREVTEAEAKKISIENKPIRGTIDLRIRGRDSEMRPEIIEELKTKNLISSCHKGDNANGVYHWRDDRWYQDFHLTIFKSQDIAVIEPLIGDYGYLIVR